ncbi:hypothetical protein C8Q76DRAFT_160342 [Earliella scabrosa]|nr:hypothetical protein C8Q76DRAFT_160342 [Earliella scabrosa]
MQLLSTTKAVDPNLVLFLRPTSANLFPWCQEFLLDTLLSSDHCPHQRLQMPVSTTTSKPHASSRTLRPSSGNMERTHVVDKTTRYFDPPSYHRDENLRPSSPVGATLAEELSRAGAKEPGSVSSKDLRGPDGILVFGIRVSHPDLSFPLTMTSSNATETFVAEGDITEVDITFDDIPVEISDLRTTISQIPTDVVADDGQNEYGAAPPAQDIPRSRRPRGPTGAADPGPSQRSGRHHRAMGPHTLRERRLLFLRAMHTMSNQPEPDPKLPRAVLNTSPTVYRGSQWKIEAGVLGDRHGSSSSSHPKLPEYMVKYGGSAVALLRARRELLHAEVRRTNSAKMLGQGSSSQTQVEVVEVPQIDEDSLKTRTERQRHDHEREELARALRDADIDAADLDEGDMEDVVNAVISAAAEAARFMG